MYKIGLSSCGFQLTEDNFIKLQEANISGIEVSMNSNEYQYINYKEISEFSKKYNVNLWSFHLPFYPFETNNISSLDENVRKNTIEYLEGFIKKGANIGIDKFIIHPSGEPNLDSERQEKMKRSMESLDILAEIAHKEGAIIAVEDLPRTCLGHDAEEIATLISFIKLCTNC